MLFRKGERNMIIILVFYQKVQMRFFRSILFLLALYACHSSIISKSALITSSPLYRSFIPLRYGQLQKHNLLRAKHQAPMLRLSSSLCHKAQLQAEEMLKNGRAAYSKEAMRGKIGQNIYGAFSPGVLTYRPHTATDYWYRNQKNYDYKTGKPKDPSKPIWQLTTMLWKGVTRVGFGYAYGPGTIGGREGTLIYIVAKYSPTPNKIGQFIENVKPPIDSFTVI